MIERLNEVEKRFDSIEEELGKTETMADIERYTSLLKERAAILPVVEKFREYKKVLKNG